MTKWLLDSKFVYVVAKVWTLLTLPLSMPVFLLVEVITFSVLRFVSGAEMVRLVATRLWNGVKRSFLKFIKSKTFSEYIFTFEEIEL